MKKPQGVFKINTIKNIVCLSCKGIEYESCRGKIITHTTTATHHLYNCMFEHTELSLMKKLPLRHYTKDVISIIFNWQWQLPQVHLQTSITII